MKVLFIGDIVGKSGRDIVSSLLYTIKKDNNIDLVIANGENSAHGKGITYKIYKELLSNGIDYITLGNHAYSKSEINEKIDLMDKLIVPYNHEKRTTDNYYKIIEYKGIRFCLTNILGNILIGQANEKPYQAFEKVLESTKHLNPDFYFVDMHSETTAEKRIFFECFKDKARVVVGTHTHIQTADEDIIDNAAFISDVGMCGTYNSIIGRDIKESIKCNVYDEETRYMIASGPAIFCAVIIEIDDKTKIPTSISRIQIRP